MTGPRAWPVVAGLIALAAGSSGARAASTVRLPAIQVAAPACETSPVPIAAFVASLRVELAGHDPPCCELRASQEILSPSALQVRLDVEPCAVPAAGVTATVTDPASGQVVSRPISLADVVPDARPRALALAVAELVRSMGEAPPPPPKVVVVVPAAPPPPPRKTTPLRVWVVAVDAVLRSFPSRHTTLWGGALSASREGRRSFASLDLGAAFGDPTVVDGSIGVRTLGAGATVGWRWAGRQLAADVGLRGELGWAWIDGRAATSGVEMGSGSGALAAVGLRLALAAPRSPVRLHGMVDAGLVLGGVTGDVNGVAAAGAAGPYLLVGLGGSFATGGESP